MCMYYDCVCIYFTVWLRVLKAETCKYLAGRKGREGKGRKVNDIKVMHITRSLWGTGTRSGQGDEEQQEGVYVE